MQVKYKKCGRPNRTAAKCAFRFDLLFSSLSDIDCMIRDSLKVRKYLLIEHADLCGAASVLQTADMRFLKLINNIIDLLLTRFKLGEGVFGFAEVEVLSVIDKGNDLSQLIHHSDRGVQYASCQYTGLLKQYNIQISMTETGNPKDNAVAERVNNTIKNELLKGMSFTSISEVLVAVKAAIRFYNEERPHLSLDGLTPREAAKKRGEIDKRWISYREKAIKAKVT